VEWLRNSVESAAMIDPEDVDRLIITDDIDEAVQVFVDQRDQASQ
jgi:hypothetical protein